MRNINITIDSATLNGMADNTAGKHREAIGCLCTWGLPKFPYVEIAHDGGNDMLAVYRAQEVGPAGFAMGAIWHELEGKYSFHS